MTITEPRKPQAPTDPDCCMSKVPTQADAGNPGSGISWQQALKNTTPQAGLTDEHRKPD